MGISASRAKLTLVACASLLLAACGGDDEPSTAANDNEPPPVSEGGPPGTGGDPTTGTPGNSGTDEPSDETPPSEETGDDDTPGGATDGGDEPPTGGTGGTPQDPNDGGSSNPDDDPTTDPSDGAPPGSDDPSSGPTDEPANPDDEPPPTEEPPSGPTDEPPGGSDEPDEPPVVENSPPTISGTPPSTVLEGTPYLFEPTASDEDGDILYFSVANLPPWADFEPMTGRLEGTPSSADIRTYEDVRISVTDGADDAYLEPFSITVTAVANGTVELSWVAPTENEDGSELTDLAGYKIYWGTKPGEYSSSVTIENPGVVTYVLEGLVPGTYYFAATAFNAEGAESDPSGEATATIS